LVTRFASGLFYGAATGFLPVGQARCITLLLSLFLTTYDRRRSLYTFHNIFNFVTVHSVMISRRILVASRFLRAQRAPQLRYPFTVQQFRSYAEKIVKVPDMAESITEGTLKQWSKQIGDYVEQDEEIATIETDKVSHTLLFQFVTWLTAF
jgi:hypothetical protein